MQNLTNNQLKHDLNSLDLIISDYNRSQKVMKKLDLNDTFPELTETYINIKKNIITLKRNLENNKNVNTMKKNLLSLHENIEKLKQLIFYVYNDRLIKIGNYQIRNYLFIGFREFKLNQITDNIDTILDKSKYKEVQRILSKYGFYIDEWEKNITINYPNELVKKAYGDGWEKHSLDVFDEGDFIKLRNFYKSNNQEFPELVCGD